MWTIFVVLVFAVGFTACWFSKDKTRELIAGAEAFAQSLESKAARLRARL
jgi:hypothetical protein